MFILQTCRSGLARAADSHRISREMLTQAANTSHLCQSIVLFTQDRHSSVNKRKTRHIQCTFSYVTLHSWTESVIDDDVRQSWRHTICPELKMCHFSVNDRPGFVYLSTISRSSSRRRTNELKLFTLLSIILQQQFSTASDINMCTLRDYSTCFGDSNSSTLRTSRDNSVCNLPRQYVLCQIPDI